MCKGRLGVPEQKVEELPIDRLRFGLSPRLKTYDPDHVAALAGVLDEVPPILVHAPTMRVIDGSHRVLAARSAGRTTIRGVLFEGDETAVQVEAVRRNVTHGKPLSLAEREAAAVRFLELAPEWSDRRIATVSGLSPKTVARLRSRATEDSAQTRERVGRDGRVRPVDATEVRNRVADAVRSDPNASNRAIAKRTGASPATVRDVRERLSRGESELPSVVEQRRQRSQPASRVSSEPSEQDAQRQTVVPEHFTAWFDERHVDDADWQSFVATIPISRVYEIADVCRRRGDSWRAFAAALEDRARDHRRATDTGTGTG